MLGEGAHSLWSVYSVFVFNICTSFVLSPAVHFCSLSPVFKGKKKCPKWICSCAEDVASRLCSVKCFIFCKDRSQSFGI